MVVARFYAHESCGQCTPCRESHRLDLQDRPPDRRGQGPQGRPRHHPGRVQARRRHHHLRLLRRRGRPLRQLHREVPRRVRGPDPARCLDRPMPKLTIDGKEVEVAPGTNLIEAARQAGVEVPHYCYHPGPQHRGPVPALHGGHREERRARRSAATPRPPTAWSCTPQTERVLETRKSIMEFHLVNHPLDCPVCDQAGECWLQIYYMKHGLYDPRMTDEKVHKPKAVPLGPHVMLDAERCILCSRCVRFCDEVTGPASSASSTAATTPRSASSRARRSRTSTRATSSTSARWARSPTATSASRCASGTSTRPSSVCTGCARGCNIEVHTNRRRPHHNRGPARRAAQAALQRRRQPVVDVRRGPLRLPLDRRRQPPAGPARGAPAGKDVAARLGRGGGRPGGGPQALPAGGDRHPRLPPDVQRGPLRAAAGRGPARDPRGRPPGAAARAGRRGQPPHPRRQEPQPARGRADRPRPGGRPRHPGRGPAAAGQAPVGLPARPARLGLAPGRRDRGPGRGRDGGVPGPERERDQRGRAPGAPERGLRRARGHLHQLPGAGAALPHRGGAARRGDGGLGHPRPGRARARRHGSGLRGHAAPSRSSRAWPARCPPSPA